MTRFFLASLAPVFLLGAGCDTPTEAPDQGADHDAEQLERALAAEAQRVQERLFATLAPHSAHSTPG